MRTSTSLNVLMLAVLALLGCAESSDSSNPEPEESATCDYEGESYAAGDVIHKTNGVSCLCLSDGAVGQCTGALEVDAGDDEACVYEGASYAVGDVVRRSEGVSCVCLEGGEIGRCTGAL